jgi:hypothetical protein
MAEKVVINSSRVVQEVSIVSQPNITKVYINNNGGGGANFNLDVSEFGDAPINNVNSIVFEGAIVTDLGSRAVKVQITGAGGVWGSILGILSDQTDLQNALNAKEDLSNKATNLTSPNNTKYPTTLAVSDAVDSLQSQIDTIDFNLGDVIAREMIENALTWMLPAFNGVGGIGYQSNIRVNTNPTHFGNQDNTAFGFGIVGYRTTTTPGSVSGVRRNDGLSIRAFNGVDIVRDFRVNSAISSDCRFSIGWSQSYNAADPTNNDQLGHLNCIYVAKLSTSNNLHIVHNDNAGTATSIDLGSNFPANDPQYKFRMFLRKTSSADYTIQIFRTTLATGVVLASTAYNLTTDLPDLTADLNQIFYITNNASAVNMFLGDYGLILKRTPL